MKNKITVFVFVMILFSVCVATLMGENRRYSELENRYLETRPEFSVSALLSGEYMKKYETYMADQIALKDSMIRLKADAVKILHQQQMNGVYFGKKGYYVKDYQPDYPQLKENLSAIEKFADTYGENSNIFLFVAPNVQSVKKDVLLSDVVMEEDKKAREMLKKVKNVTYVDPTDLLIEHKEEAIYFKTDHHWTMRGAYYGYEALAKKCGWNYKKEKDYNVEVKSEEFYGTLYSKAPLSFAKPDSLEVFENILGKYRVTFEDGTYMDSLFSDVNLHIKDKYTYFLDGNHSKITIQSNADTKKKALVFKDSYSHALLPFLADQYDTIDVIDLRYYHDSVKEWMQNSDYDDVFFLYNLDFITTDNNFVWLDVTKE